MFYGYTKTLIMHIPQRINSLRDRHAESQQVEFTCKRALWHLTSINVIMTRLPNNLEKSWRIAHTWLPLLILPSQPQAADRHSEAEERLFELQPLRSDAFKWARSSTIQHMTDALNSEYVQQASLTL